MDRKFEISPKTPHDWLKVQKWNPFDVRLKVARDIVLNVCELVPGIDRREITNLPRTIHIGKSYSGEYALVYTVAGNFGATAQHLGYGMHYPEMVYMSGYYFGWLAGKIARDLEHRGTIGSEQSLDRAKTFRGYEDQIFGALAEYVQQNLPAEERDLEILRALIYLPNRYVREKVCQLLNDQDKVGAYTVLEVAKAI